MMEDRILEYIRAYTERVGYPPTHQEIADGCGISSQSTVSCHLDRLTASGRITRKPGSPRSIVVVTPPINLTFSGKTGIMSQISEQEAG